MLRRYLCRISIFLAVGLATSAFGEEPVVSDQIPGDVPSHSVDTATPDSVKERPAHPPEPASGDSLGTAAPESTTARPSSFHLPPYRFPAPDFFYTKESVIDFDRGIVTTVTTVGGVPVRPPEVRPLDKFIYESIAERLRENLTETRRRLMMPEREGGGPVIQMQFAIPNLPPMAKSIIGEGPSTLHISGYGRITMSGRSQYRSGETVGANLHQSKFPTLSMQQELSFQIEGTIGSKIYVSIDQDTKRTSDLENSIRLLYKGDEDEVIQEIEAGNTNLSLPGSQFVSGGRQHSGLFGIKTRAQFGNLELTMIASQQKSSSQKKTFRGGAQATDMRIRDTDYLARRFFFLDESYRIQYGKALETLRANPSMTELDIGIGQGRPWARQIRDVRVYQGIATTAGVIDAQDGFGIHAMLTDSSGNDIPHKPYDPADLQRQAEGSAGQIRQGGWQLIPSTEYYLDTDLGYVDFGSSLPDGAILGVVITFVNQVGVIDSFPKSTDPKVLVVKMIKYGQSRPSDPTWTYEWRNVYSVGARDLSPNDFKLEIVDGQSPSKPNTPQSSAQTYLQVMQLDVASGVNLEGSPDGLVDLNAAKVDLKGGLVYFPYLEPFKEAFADLKGEGNPGIYESNDRSLIRDKYEIVATYSKASTRIQLGFNVLENSEVVKLKGARLTKNVDYRIDYLTGELLFTQTVADQVSQPGADLSIDYEVNPFFKPEQESLVGLSGVYKLGERGSVGSIFMYNSERTSTTRVRVGEEPTRMTVFATYANYEFRPDWLTGAVDWLPLIETDEPSVLRLEGEVAQSLPNLNTRGVGYIDDFEGSGNRTPLGISRRGWFLASPPVDLLSKPNDLPREQLGKFVWFNPYNQVKTVDVFTTRSESELTQSERYMDVLNFWFRPTGSTPSEREKSWGGVMRSFGSEGVDLQRTQFIEIWVRGSTTPFYPERGLLQAEPSRGKPVLHIDLGDISENAWYSPQAGIFRLADFNNEDYILNTTYVNEKWREFRNNGILDFDNSDQGEDVGLDGCPDKYEDGHGGCLDTPNPNYPQVQDPNGDNWSYTKGSVYGYEYINGTEFNYKDGEGVPRPDNEDLNGNGSLDRTNSYLSYKIELSENSPYAVPETEQPTSGFRLYRIPLKELGIPEVDSSGTSRASFQRITSARLWVSGVPDTAFWVTVASIDFVGNNWEELKSAGEEFSVTTVNTHDNRAYLPPPGVQREQDPLTGALRSEQSLVVQFDHIGPGQTYRAQRDLVRNQDYTNYSRLRMYVHGPETGLNPTWDHLAAFLRIGLDSTSYYELRIPRLYPGWDERNFIDVHLDSLTNLKLTQNGEVFSGVDTISSDGKMRIVGAQRGVTVTLPSLSSIRILQIGITNLSDHVIRGQTTNQPVQVWFDELRLEGVRNISGRAMRANANFKMADVANFQVAASRQEIGFGGLQDKQGSTMDSRTFSISMDRFRIDKLVPPGWRVSIPVNVSYSVNTSVPWLKRGSDIQLVREEDKAIERGRSETFNASTSFAKTSQSRNPVVGLTLDRVNLGLTYGLTHSLTPTPSSRDSSSLLSYTARFNYDLTPRRARQVKLFGWMPSLMPDAITESEFAYLPTSLRFDGSATFSSDSTWRKQKVLGRDTTYVQGRRVFTLSEAYRLGLQPWRSVTASYDLSLNRDLQDALGEDISAAAVAQSIAANIFRHHEIRRSQNTSLSYSPQWPWWLSQSYSLTNRYNDDSDPRTSAGMTRAQGRQFSITSQRSYSPSYTFKLKDLLTRLSGSAPPGRVPGAQPPRGQKPEAAPRDSARAGGYSPVRALRSVSGFLGNHLENITGRVSYSDDYRGTQIPDSLRPNLVYQIFGIGAHPGLGDETRTVRSQNAITKQFGWDAATGLQLPFRMRVQGKYSFRTQRTFTVRDTSRTRDVTFPDMTYTWDGLESLPVLKWVVTRSDIQSAFQQQRTERWTKASQLPERLESRSTSYRFSPLFAWTVLWKFDVRTTLRATWERRLDDRNTGTSLTTTETTNWSAGMTATYELQTSRGIKKPWGEGVWRLSGNINFSLDANLNGSRVAGLNANVATGGDLLQTHTRGWSIKPRASYQFSRMFNGQAEIEVGATKDLKLRSTTNVRALSISGELRFN